MSERNHPTIGIDQENSGTSRHGPNGPVDPLVLILVELIRIIVQEEQDHAPDNAA
jgi:hypothetical protein